MPLGQGVQVDEPELEYVPTAQLIQEEEPDELEYDPASQAIHTELVVAPTDVEYDPGEHRVQLAPPKTEYDP